MSILKKRIHQLIMENEKQKINITKLNDELSSEKKLEKVVENQKDKQDSEIKEEHRRIDV
jgi:regulator of replication initiation timing